MVGLVDSGHAGVQLPLMGTGVSDVTGGVENLMPGCRRFAGSATSTPVIPPGKTTSANRRFRGEFTLQVVFASWRSPASTTS